MEKATYTNSVGSVELKTVWTDPAPLSGLFSCTLLSSMW